jgi:hemoglobin
LSALRAGRDWHRSGYFLTHGKASGLPKKNGSPLPFPGVRAFYLLRCRRVRPIFPFARTVELCKTRPMADTDLLQRLGGPEGVSRIVFAVCDHILASERLEPFFKAVNMRRLIEHQTKLISLVVGGSASQTNEELRDAHADLGIDAVAFREMLSHLRATLQEFGVAAADINSVMTEIEKREEYIVANGHGSRVA